MTLRRYHIQGYVTIPKSSNADRIASNAAVFEWELSEPQMRLIDALEQGFLASNACKAQRLPWSDVK